MKNSIKNILRAVFLFTVLLNKEIKSSINRIQTKNNQESFFKKENLKKKCNDYYTKIKSHKTASIAGSIFAVLIISNIIHRKMRPNGLFA